MSFRTIVAAACSFACCLSVPARSQCRPGMDTQIAQMMKVWLQGWNEKRMDDLMKLHYSHAVLLPADGRRASGPDEIRASLQKQIGSKVEVRSLGPPCSGDLAYENGTYTQTGNGQSVEGNYLVVLIWSGGKWLIVQHASTVKQRLN